MKRIIAIILLCILIVSIQVPASAKEKPITDADAYGLNAEQLVGDALRLFYQHMFGDLSFGDERDYEQEVDPSCLEYPEYSSAYERIDPSKLIGGSPEGLYDTVKGIYTEPLAQIYLKHGHSMDLVPKYVIDGEGKVFRLCDGQAQRYILPYDPYDYPYKETVEVLENDGKRANARVRLIINDFSRPHIVNGDLQGFSTPTDAYVECRFENTADGWRITECPFFEMLRSSKSNFAFTPVDAPSTSDSAVGYFVLLPVLALACLAPLPLVRKKRHRA